MKARCIFITALCMAGTAAAQQKIAAVPDPKQKIQTVKAACGQCKFGMPGKGCNLAVKIKGNTYFTDSTSIDDHGDAHADDGFCKKIRTATVQGTIVNNRFVVTYFKLKEE